MQVDPPSSPPQEPPPLVEFIGQDAGSVVSSAPSRGPGVVPHASAPPAGGPASACAVELLESARHEMIMVPLDALTARRLDAWTRRSGAGTRGEAAAALLRKALDMGAEEPSD
jgi:hypothetical protein